MTRPPAREWAERHLENAHNYWLATTRPDGRPHLVPIWGVWLGERFWCATFAGVKVENIAAQPTVVLTTETPREVVLLDGRCSRVSEGDLPPGYAATFEAKYGPGWSGVGEPTAIHLCIVPTHARAWRESDASQPPARWRYPSAG